jgi:hypothetical protein
LNNDIKRLSLEGGGTTIKQSPFGSAQVHCRKQNRKALFGQRPKLLVAKQNRKASIWAAPKPVISGPIKLQD